MENMETCFLVLLKCVECLLQSFRVPSNICSSACLAPLADQSDTESDFDKECMSENLNAWIHCSSLSCAFLHVLNMQRKADG